MVIEGNSYLIADVKILSFSFSRYIRQEKRVLKDGLNSAEVIEELKAYSNFLGISLLNQLEYYLGKDPIGIREI